MERVRQPPPAERAAAPHLSGRARSAMATVPVTTRARPISLSTARTAAMGGSAHTWKIRLCGKWKMASHDSRNAATCAEDGQRQARQPCSARRIPARSPWHR